MIKVCIAVSVLLCNVVLETNGRSLKTNPWEIDNGKLQPIFFLLVILFNT